MLSGGDVSTDPPIRHLTSGIHNPELTNDIQLMSANKQQAMISQTTNKLRLIFVMEHRTGQGEIHSEEHVVCKKRHT